jgi:hypothetical protein
LSLDRRVEMMAILPLETGEMEHEQLKLDTHALVLGLDHDPSLVEMEFWMEERVEMMEILLEVMAALVRVSKKLDILAQELVQVVEYSTVEIQC